MSARDVNHHSKWNLFAAANEFLRPYQKNCDELFDHTVIADEMWILFLIVETEQCRTRMYIQTGTLKKEKLTASVFKNRKGSLLVELCER